MEILIVVVLLVELVIGMVDEVEVFEVMIVVGGRK